MIHFGDALRLWIRGKGYDFISDFVEDVSGFNRGTPEHVSFRNKLNTVLKKSRFSKLNWKNLETLIPDLTREELEEIAQAPPTHPPTYEQHSKPIQKIEERPVVYDEKTPPPGCSGEARN